MQTKDSGSSEPSTIRLVIRAEIVHEDAPPEVASELDKRAVAAAVTGVILVVVLGWLGINALRTNPTSSAPDAPPPAVAVTPTKPSETTIDTPPSPATSFTERASPSSAAIASDTKTDASLSRTERDGTPAPINEVIPDVPRSALQTIRGTIRVSIRVSMDKTGAVTAAATRVPGPSRYFERLALQASRKWTFTPTDTSEKRNALVHFSFTRDGVTASAERAR